MAQRKRLHIARQIGALQAGERVVARVGGATRHSRGLEIAFQRERIAELDWALADGRTEQEIRDRIAAYETTLTAEELARKYGSMRGLSSEAVKTLALISLLEVALGTHQGS
jgi:acetyl-CoA acetyltransferase